jgi:hypothetical protein
LSELNNAVVTVCQDCSYCKSRKREQPEEHLRTGFNAWAFSHLLAVLFTPCILTVVEVDRQLRLCQQPKKTNAIGAVRWIIHYWVTLLNVY